MSTPHHQRIDSLIAHRGYAARHIENTFTAISAALECGARHIEVDVQLTGDLIPVLFHDRTLQRLAGQDQEVADLALAQIEQLTLRWQPPTEKTWIQSAICTLDQLIPLMEAYPHVHWFIELKRASLSRVTAAQFVRIVRDILQPHLQQCTVISFAADILAQARAAGIQSLGWVLEKWDEASLARAAAFRPQWIFVDRNDIPERLQKFPSADWSWAVYEIDDAATAMKLLDMGVQLIETFHICELAKSLAHLP